MNDENLSLLQAVQKWPRVTIYCLALSLNILLWGYDTAIVGSVSSMPEFQRVFGVPHEDRYIIPTVWYSLFGIALPLGQMLGAVVGGWLQDTIGRRIVVGIGGILSIGAIAICYLADLASYKNPAFFGGKFTEGVAVGVIICATQTYMSEVIPTRLRGPVLALFPAVQLIGQLAASFVVLSQINVESAMSYRIAIASEWPFCAVPLILAFILPESPNWLLQKDREEQASKALQRLHGEKNRFATGYLYREMQQAVSEERENSKRNTSSYLECFRGTDLRRSLIVVFCVGLPDFFGVHLLGNASYFLQQVGMAADTSMIMMIVGVLLGLAGNIGSFWTLSHFGRRTLMLFALAVITLLWLSIGISGVVPVNNSVTLFVVIMMMTVITLASLTVWPSTYVVSSETSSLRLRSKTQGIGWLCGGVIKTGFDLGCPYLYNADAANLGAKTGFFYVGTALLAFGITFVLVPELKGRSAVEIDRLFNMRIPAWRFRGANVATYGEEDSAKLHLTVTGGSSGDYLALSKVNTGSSSVYSN